MKARACSPDEARATLACLASEKTDTGGGKYSLDSIMERGQCFVVEGEGGIVAAYVLQAQGPELWVMAAAGAESGACLTAEMAGQIEARAKAHGFASVGFQTKRRGLVRKAEKLGYEVAGYIMRKKTK